MQPYTDVHGRAWELTPTPVHNAYAGGHVIGYLCWVKSAAPNSHPGDYARTGHSRRAPYRFSKPCGRNHGGPGICRRTPLKVRVSPLEIGKGGQATLVTPASRADWSGRRETGEAVPGATGDCLLSYRRDRERPGPTKGEIVASLADERLRSLHEEFREGARRHPDLLFAALAPLHPEETAWPEVPIRSASELGPQFSIAVPDHPEGTRWNAWEIRDSSEVLSQSPIPESLLAQYRSIGFTGGTFCDLLGNLPCEYRLVPVLVCWLQIEGLLWEGVFYDGDVRKYASHLRDEEAVEQRRAYCVAGVNWFAQLARRCALQFSLLYEPDAKVIASCRREHVALVWETLVKRESRWLENLCNMPFVQADTVVRPWGQYRLRRFAGDVFTASAMAVESLISGSTIVSPLAAGPEQDKRNMKSLVWLVEEIFRPAVDIAQMLADADWDPGAVLSTQEYHDALSHLRAGLECADKVRQDLPQGDVQLAVQNLQMTIREFESMNDPATAQAIGHSLHIPARLGWVAILHHLPPGSPAPPNGLLPSRRPLAGARASTLDADITEPSTEILGEEQESGLYGRVFKGKQTALERIVAVKIIRPDWPDAADIIQHAKAIAQAGLHPNIVTVHCVEQVRVPGFDQPQTAMIMEWLDGERLDRRLGAAKFDAEQVRRICIGILDGVQHMHANGTAHGRPARGQCVCGQELYPEDIRHRP